MIRWKQEVDEFPDFGLVFGNPDFVAYAKSYGARGARVAKASECQTMLEAAFREGGVHLVVVPIDYSENMRVLVDELQAGHPGRVKPSQAKRPGLWAEALAGHKSIADVDAARAVFGVDDAIAGVGVVGAAVASTVVPIAGKPVMVVMTESAKAMAAAKTVSTTEVVPTAVKATAATVSTETTGGRGRSEHCGRSERDKYESKFTKHFYLHLCGAGCTVSMLRSYAAGTGAAVRQVTQAIDAAKGKRIERCRPTPGRATQ